MTEAKITRAAVLRLYPNRQQASALRRWQGGLRYVWNAALDCVFTSRDINTEEACSMAMPLSDWAFISNA